MKRIALVLCAACLSICVLAAPAIAHTHSRVYARGRITVQRGGSIQARNGWSLFVPAHVVTRDSEATISRVSAGVVNNHIDGPWKGRVRVTGPIIKGDDVIAHDLGGLWVPEGSRLGQRTVWVSHLSWFSLGSLLTKAEDFLCLTSEDGYDFVGCVVGKGLEWADQAVMQWLISKLDHDCVSDLIADGLYGGGKASKVSLEMVKNALDQANCRGQASSPGPPTPTPKPTPTPTPTPTPSPTPMPTPTPIPVPTPSPSPGTTEGFVIDDSIYGGTWARTDPNDGTWYGHSTAPPNAAY